MNFSSCSNLWIMKPKAKTLIERHGFVDPDRKTSAHDEIQIWIFNNAVQVLKSFTSKEKQIQIDYRKLEYPIHQISQNYKAIVGFVDLVVHAKVLTPLGDGSCNTKSIRASIEIKNKIDSCGDLIRQINFYRSFEQIDTIWIVVSPDDRFKDVLFEQGIYFYKYLQPGQTSFPYLTVT